jgi:hypothetical protein
VDSITRTFRGDPEGTATAELLTAMLHHRGVAGPDGSFVNDGFVVADSATGELTGLRGTATIAVADDGTHHLTLDYQLAPTS